MTVRPFEILYRQFNTLNSPASGAHKPVKVDVRDTLVNLFSKFTGSNAGALIQTSKDDLDMLSADDNTMAWVLGDDDPELDGVYQYDDGDWLRRAALPYNVIQLDNQNTGTANAIQVTTAVGVPSAAYGALYVLNITADNTGAVTVEINGGVAKPLVLNVGLPIPADYLRSGMAVICVDDGVSLRLFSYGDASAIQVAAEDAADRAELAAQNIEGLVPSVDNRTQLKALDTSLIDFAFMIEPLPSGADWKFNCFWKYEPSITIAKHQADTTEGILVAPNAAANGAWVRQFNGPKQLWWFGAELDGATDDTAALKAAAGVGYGSEITGSGSMVLTAANDPAFGISFPDDCIIDGKNELTIIINSPVSEGQMFEVASEDLLLKNLRIEAGTIQSAASIVFFRMEDGMRRFRVENCEFDGGVNGTPASRNHVAHLFAVPETGSSREFAVIDCSVRNFNRGFLKTNTSTHYMDRVTFRGGIWENFSKACINFNSPLGTLANVTVQGVKFANPFIGSVDGTESTMLGFASAKKLSITGCDFAGQCIDGIHVEEAAEVVTITGNTMALNASGAAIKILDNNVHNDTDFLTPSRFSITGNTIKRQDGLRIGVGILLVNDASGESPLTTATVAANTIDGWNRGIQSGSLSIDAILISTNQIDDCIRCIQLARGAPSVAGNQLSNSTTGVYIDSGQGIVGKNHFINVTTELTSASATGSSAIAGYSKVFEDETLGTGTTNFVLADVGLRMIGNFALSISGAGAPDARTRLGSISFDGSFTKTSFSPTGTANLNIDIGSVGGNLVAIVTNSTGGSVDADIVFDFTGFHNVD